MWNAPQVHRATRGHRAHPPIRPPPPAETFQIGTSGANQEHLRMVASSGHRGRDRVVDHLAEERGREAGVGRA